MTWLRFLLNPWADAREQRLLERCACLEVELIWAEKAKGSRDRLIQQLTRSNRALRAENESNRMLLRALGDSYQGGWS